MLFELATELASSPLLGEKVMKITEYNRQYKINPYFL
jgi:hypothetical protein